ncbi:MAG: SPASM domain-containing protein, partial [Candidatus Scalindua sp.]|nr:SPASM domain-containing protein [Candidatus Scalindua sp.]
MKPNIFIEITTYCNMSCSYCPSPTLERPRLFMEENLFYKIIDEIKKEKITDTVYFHLMGEPLLHPKVFDFMKYAFNNSLKIILVSNISSIRTRKMEIKSILQYVNYLEISLQSFDEGSFKEKKTKNISFKEYIDLIKDIIETKYAINFECQINIQIIENSKTKFKNFKKGIRLLSNNTELKKFMDQYFTNFFEVIANEYQLDYKPLKIQKLNYKKFHYQPFNNVSITTRPVTTWANNMIESNKVIPAIFGKCNALHKQIGILANGDVVPCCLDYNANIVLGNCQNVPLTEIINSNQYQRLKEGFKKGILHHSHCKKCKGGINPINWFLTQAYSFYK